ncbi:unnamed protein product [Ectocarpus sp. 6 AP-2014]
MVCLSLSRYVRSVRRHAIGGSELFVVLACFRCNTLWLYSSLVLRASSLPLRWCRVERRPQEVER